MRKAIKLYNSNKYELGNNKYEKERQLNEIKSIADIPSIEVTWHIIAITFFVVTGLILHIIA